MPSEARQQLEQVELTIEQAEKQIEAMKALDRLKENKDFKTLILDGYLKDEASRVVLAKAEPGLQEEGTQAQLLRMIDGIGYFRQYLNKIFQFGAMAERTLESHRETRNELMQEI